MSTTTYSRNSLDDKSHEDLQKDILEWDKMFQMHTEEMIFLKELLSADVFKVEIPNLYERLQEFYNDLLDLKTEKIDLHEELRNHKNDLNGMMECEDIGCESFYHNQHQDLSVRIDHHLTRFQSYKVTLYRFCTPLLRKQQEN